MDTSFTPLPAAIGGILIGTASALSLALNGKIPGISGIFSRCLTMKKADTAWRVLFLIGIIGGAIIAFQLEPKNRPLHTASLGNLVAAGLLVGFGTRLGGGCTSGHGICGIGMGARDSLIATLIFMAVGMLTVFIIRHFI